MGEDREKETLDEAAAIEALNEALALQHRSALQFSLTSSSLTGIPAQAIGGLLIGMGDQELADARELVEKIVSFEGTPPTGREGRSEALEHMLEHMIMRKQRQVDLIARARRDG